MGAAKAWAVTLIVSANALIVFHLLLVIQIESHKQWSWPLVFIPLWVSFVFAIAFMVWYVDAKGAWWLALGMISMGIFTIILAVKLADNHSSISWYGVFAPFWLGLAILLMVDESWPKYKHKYTTEYYENTGVFERYFQVYPKLGLVAFAIYAILHSIHLEQHYYMSWPIIFSPFLAFTGLFMLTVISNSSYLYSSDIWSLGILPFLSALVFIAFEILLLMYLMGYIHSFAVANIPLYLCELVLWFGVCVLFCVFH